MLNNVFLYQYLEMSGTLHCPDLLIAVSFSISPTVLVPDGLAKIDSWELVAPVALTAASALGSDNLNVTLLTHALVELKTKMDKLCK